MGQEARAGFWLRIQYNASVINKQDVQGHWRPAVLVNVRVPQATVKTWLQHLRYNNNIYAAWGGGRKGSGRGGGKRRSRRCVTKRGRYEDNGLLRKKERDGRKSFFGGGRKICVKFLKKVCGIFFWGGGTFWGKVKKRCEKTFFWGGGNKFGALFEAGDQDPYPVPACTLPPPQIQNWPGTSGGFLPWGQGSHPHCRDGRGGGWVKRALCDSNKKIFLWGE